MSQENLQTMIMQNFGGVKEVYYGIVQVVNYEVLRSRRHYMTTCYAGSPNLIRAAVISCLFKICSPSVILLPEYIIKSKVNNVLCFHTVASNGLSSVVL